MSKRKIKRIPVKQAEPRSMAFGLGWYDASQWDRLLEISVDREELEATHEEWLTAAEKTEANLSKAGVDFKRVDVDVEALLAWCNRKGRAVDGSARSEFISWTLSRM